MNYDTEVNVKYKEIEEELLEKIKQEKINQENVNDLGYTEEDVSEICNELYKHELLLVFKVDDISNKKVGQIITDLWEKVNANSKFLDVIKVYKNKLIQMDLEQTFTLMFNYGLFSSLHKCIVSLLTLSESDINLLDINLLDLENTIHTIL